MIEFLYGIIIVLSIAIAYKTQQMYSLCEYDAMKYFRNIFIFAIVSYGSLLAYRLYNLDEVLAAHYLTLLLFAFTLMIAVGTKHIKLYKLVHRFLGILAIVLTGLWYYTNQENYIHIPLLVAYVIAFSFLLCTRFGKCLTAFTPIFTFSIGLLLFGSFLHTINKIFVFTSEIEFIVALLTAIVFGIISVGVWKKSP